MKWKKIGKVFDSSRHPDFGEYDGFAQSPQALVLADRVRVYFSIRKKDEVGKFLSNVSFVDFDRTMSKIIGVAKRQVISLGSLGDFDEHGIFPFSPFHHGGKVLAYTCGWSRRVSVSVETSTGFAISDDGGYSFRKFGIGPVLSASLNEPFLVGDSFVRFIGGRFRMWYIFGTGWLDFPGESNADRIYKIGYAESEDGVNWERLNRALLPDVLDENECQALPSVLLMDGVYHMVFCFRHATGFRKDPTRGYRLGYASSFDGRSWTRNDAYLGLQGSQGDWDGNMQCYPHIFSCNNEIFLLYNGNDFGRFGFGLAKLDSF